MSKRRNNSSQPSFSMKVWRDLSYAIQVWQAVCQDSDRLPTIDSIKAFGTEDGPWHIQDGVTYRKLKRTVEFVCETRQTVLQIELEGFEVHERGRETKKWHLVQAKLVGNAEVEVWSSREEAWMRNTHLSPVQPAYTVMYYDHNQYYNAHRESA